MYSSFCRNEISRKRGKVICRICEDLIFNVEHK